MSELAAGLYLVATPLGNMGDISVRAQDVLTRCDVIACEDTREMKKLLQLLDISRDPSVIISVHEHNEHEKSPQIIERIKAGDSVVYASDAGMPAISDPGALLVAGAHSADVMVTCVPGPSAVVTAVALSGFPSSAFMFVGFVPRSGKERTEFFSHVQTASDVIVAYESPQRISSTLASLAEHLGERQVVVCRELTKKFEEVFRGTASEVAEHFADTPKGECVIVIDAAVDVESNLGDDDDVISALRTLVAAGVSSKDCVEILVSLTHYPKNDLKEMYATIRDAQK